MKRQLSLLAVALLLAQPVLAKDIPLNRARNMQIRIQGFWMAEDTF